MMTLRDLTVVCGGGGLGGAAWMIGLVMGLAEAGIEIRDAATFVGTSAGAVVASQLTSTAATQALFDWHADPAVQPALTSPPAATLTTMMVALRRSQAHPKEKPSILRELASGAPPMSREDRRAQVELRLGIACMDWPERNLSITAVDLQTGELVVFTRDNGINLLDAVCASTALPGVWPTTEIHGRTYIDGGFWKTPENAHLAIGSRRVLVLAPFGSVGDTALRVPNGLAADVAFLTAKGSRVAVIAADQRSMAAMTPNPLNPSTRQPAAEAGRRQGNVAAAQLNDIF